MARVKARKMRAQNENKLPKMSSNRIKTKGVKYTSKRKGRPNL